MLIVPRTNLVELHIGTRHTVMDKRDAREVVALLGIGSIKRYRGYKQPALKVGQQSGPCINITEQYKKEHGYA